MKQQGLLHLCSYYFGSSVYKDLFDSLSGYVQPAHQYVFSAVRRTENLNRLPPSGSTLVAVRCLNELTRLSFVIKQVTIFISFILKFDTSILRARVDLIHAHTLYSDGFLAFFISCVFKKKYVLTIRSTDVNLGLKFYAHWGWLTKLVIKNAECVVFLSRKHESIIKDKFGKNIKRSCIVPNGVRAFWIENSLQEKAAKSLNETLVGVYVGVINKNKNIESAIKGFFQVTEKGKKKFIVVGGTYAEYCRHYRPLSADLVENVLFVGQCSKEQVLQHLVTSDIFVMPSIFETFGLSYIESISQLTPVVYSRGQGIDGLFDDGVIGFPCNPRNVTSICDAINKTLEVFPLGISFQKENPVKDFSWEKIAEKMMAQVYCA